MSQLPFDESLLTAYLDDELTQDERDMVESALRESPQLKNLLQELRIVRQLVANAMRNEDDKLSGNEAPISGGDAPASFSIQGPWQSSSIAISTDNPPATGSPGNTLALEQDSRPALRGWMMLASLAATVLLGLFVFSPWKFSPWKIKQGEPIASVQSAHVNRERVESASSFEASHPPRALDAPLAPSPKTAGEMLPDRVAIAPPAAASPIVVPPSDPPFSNADSLAVRMQNNDVPRFSNLGGVSEALVKLLTDANSRTERNRSEFDSMARRLNREKKSATENTPSLAMDEKLQSQEADTAKPLDADRLVDRPHFVFVLSSLVDAVPSSEPTGAVAASSGVPEQQAKVRASGGGFGGGLAIKDAIKLPAGSSGLSDTIDAGLKENRNRKATDPNDGLWKLAALDRPESSQGPSSQLVIEFRFPKDRSEQAIAALRDLGVILRAEEMESDLPKTLFFGEIDDSRQAIFGPVEYGLVERDKSDPMESETLSEQPRYRSEPGMIPDDWHAIRIVLRRRIAENE